MKELVTRIIAGAVALDKMGKPTEAQRLKENAEAMVVEVQQHMLEKYSHLFDQASEAAMSWAMQEMLNANQSAQFSTVTCPPAPPTTSAAVSESEIPTTQFAVVESNSPRRALTNNPDAARANLDKVYGYRQEGVHGTTH